MLCWLWELRWEWEGHKGVRTILLEEALVVLLFVLVDLAAALLFVVDLAFLFVLLDWCTKCLCRFAERGCCRTTWSTSETGDFSTCRCAAKPTSSKTTSETATETTTKASSKASPKSVGLRSGGEWRWCCESTCFLVPIARGLRCVSGA